MSNHVTARRIAALTLVTAGVFGAAATTASADTGRHHRPVPWSKVVIDDINVNRSHHRHHSPGGTVELDNKGRAGQNLRGWRICDDDRNCMRLSGYLRAHHETSIPVRFLDRGDRVYLVNNYGRVVDVKMAGGWHHRH